MFAYLAFAAYIACRALRFDIICCSFFPRESLRWFPMPKSVAEGIARNNDDGASSAQHGIGASDEEMRQARAAKKAALIRLLKIYLIEIVCLVLFVVIVVSAKNAAMKKRKARSQESESRHVQCDERRGTPPLSSLCAA